MIAQSLLGRTTVSPRVREIGLRILAILFILTLFVGGVQLRRWIGENTRHVRYQHDIINAFYWGQETLKEGRSLSPDNSSANSWTGLFRGYLALYDRVKDDAYESDYGLDYPPLRLLTMAIWSKQVRDDLFSNDSPNSWACRINSGAIRSGRGDQSKSPLIHWRNGWSPTGSGSGRHMATNVSAAKRVARSSLIATCLSWVPGTIRSMTIMLRSKSTS